MSDCFVVGFERNMFVIYSCSYGSPWILNGVLNSFVDNLLISLMMTIDTSVDAYVSKNMTQS